MARVFNGILDGFSGTVGTVVGANWRGINTMRAKSHKRRTSMTDKQKMQRDKFTLIRGFLQSMNDVLSLGFKDYATGMSPINSALSYNFKTAIGNYPDYNIDYPNVVISRGALPNGKSPSAVAGAAGVVNFNWTNNTGNGKAKPTDKAILVAYCAALNKTEYAIASSRSAGTASLQVADFSGQPVQAWISFISEEGKLTATSEFAGVVNVL